MNRMYKIFILIVVMILSNRVQAQDYQAFPYDTVFFESGLDGKPLLPLVKSEDGLQVINNGFKWMDIAVLRSYDTQLRSYPLRSWIGNPGKIGDRLYFETSQSDTIFIDLSFGVMEKDTFAFTDVFDEGIRYVELTCESIDMVSGDEQRTYRFAFLDENYQASNFGSAELYNIKDGTVNEADYYFLISESQGVLASPDFNYFPYCEQYFYRDRIDAFLDLNTSTAYKIFQRNPGDEIHTLYDYDESNPWSMSQKRKDTAEKKRWISQEYHADEQWLIQEYDWWKREYSFDFSPGGPPEESTNFEFIPAHRDTVFLDDYLHQLPLIPNGWGGYFYMEETNNFVYENCCGTIAIVGDSLVEVSPIFDASSVSLDYRFGLGGAYFNRDYAFIGATEVYDIVYYKKDGEEWGIPFEEHWLLDQEEQTATSWMELQADVLKIHIEHIDTLEIYDPMGRLVMRKKLVKNELSLRGLDAGVYFIQAYRNGKMQLVKYLSQN